MVEEKKINEGGMGITDYISECVKVSAPQLASEKVTNMVGTFLNEDSPWLYLQANSLRMCESTNSSNGIRKGYQWRRPVMVGTFFN